MNKHEKVDLVHKTFNIRVRHSLSEEVLDDILSFKLDVTKLVVSPFNIMRDEIMDYIAKYKDEIALPCDGNCYGHTDGVVLNCYLDLKKILKEDENG